MTTKHLLVLAALAGAAVSVSAQSVKTGIEAWQRHDYAGAAAAWRPLAEKGDPDAQFNLAQAYRLGRGVPINLAAAKTWFERAARQGHIDAETTLGLMLFQNNDLASGLNWLKKAAEQGESRALLVYGTALVNGDGVTREPVRGYAYVSRAAAQGLQPAKQTLADLDHLIPAAERKRGVALARQLAKSAPAPASHPQRKSRLVRVMAASPVSPRPSVKAPVKALAPVDPAKVVAADNWRIQLGAFSQKGAAEALYRKLSDSHALRGRQPIFTAIGPVTRLQVGPYASKAAADAACREARVPCFAVPTR